MASKGIIDPCADSAWPPKVAGTLNPTVARAVTLHKSPGPEYMLPGLVGFIGHDPRSVHLVGPAYTIKGRHNLKEFDHSPGPIYLPFSKTSGKGFSIKSRTKERITNDGPGPAAYMLVPLKSCNLGISLRQRLKDNYSSQSPGPAAYNLPSMIGCQKPLDKTSAPCHSIAGKPKVVDRTTGPGPGAYTIVNDCSYKPCPPKFSISPRVYPPGMGCITPGPGAYCPEKVRYLKEAPHYSFGIRWSEKANKEILDKEIPELKDDCPISC